MEQCKKCKQIKNHTTCNCSINENNNIGCMIAQRITSALTGMGIGYNQLADVIYKECIDIAKEQKNGDWLEMPNGDTYTKTYTCIRCKHD